jgi:hypothetical protein
MPLSSYYRAIKVLIDVESVSSCKGDVEVSIFLNNVLMFTSLKNFDSRVDTDWERFNQKPLLIISDMLRVRLSNLSTEVSILPRV